MAYTKIRVINTERHLKRALRYGANEEKTIEVFDNGGIERLINYAGKPEKTIKEKYVTGINCNPDTAAEKMAHTKRIAGKEDGRLGYHIIQTVPSKTAHPF